MEDVTSYPLGSKIERKIFNHTLSCMVIPITFQSFMTAAVSTSDAIMVGFLEQEALSAVSLAGQVTFVLNLFVIVLVQGTTLMAAQYWGKEDRKSVEKIFGLAMQCMAIIVTAFFLVSIFFPTVLMGFFTNEQALITRGADYLKIAGFSYIPLGLSQIYLCIMKNSGKTFMNTVIASMSMVLNILLNGIFIFGLFGLPSMGIKGAALATVISMCVQMAWVFMESLKKDSIRLKLRYFFKADALLKKDFVKYTMPIAGNYFFWGLGTTFYSVIIGHMGNDAVAANSIANIVKNLITCTSKGVATAGGIMIGNALGKNMLAEAKVHARRLVLFSGICGIVSGLVILILRPVILSHVTLTPQAIQYLSGMLLICSYYVIPGAIDSLVIGGIFCAGGKSKFGLFADAIVIWGMVVPIAAMSAFYWHLPVLFVYFVLCMDECIKIPAVYFYFKRYSWANNITR